MKRALLIIGCFFTLGSAGLLAQDIHFSQFYLSPLNLNPALTGVMNCSQRVVINYRNQWASALGANAYNTYSASYDQKVPVGRADYFGIGGTFWGDVAGELRFGTMQGRLSFSFSKYMGGSRNSANYLVVGADAGVTQRRVRPGDARWPSQQTNGVYDPGAGSSEPITNSDFLFADVAGGILWFSVLDEKNSYYLGAAVHHLNQANVSFLGQEVSLFSKYTIHGGGEFELTPKLSVLPGAVVMLQGPHREYNGGASVRFQMGPSSISSQYFQVGAWYRLGTKDSGGLHSDAIILSTRFETGNYGFGFSYDMTTSKFRQAGTANGSFEFSFNYLLCGPERRAVYCPTF